MLSVVLSLTSVQVGAPFRRELWGSRGRMACAAETVCTPDGSAAQMAHLWRVSALSAESAHASPARFYSGRRSCRAPSCAPRRRPCARRPCTPLPLAFVLVGMPDAAAEAAPPDKPHTTSASEICRHLRPGCRRSRLAAGRLSPRCLALRRCCLPPRPTPTLTTLAWVSWAARAPST